MNEWGHSWSLSSFVIRHFLPRPLVHTPLLVKPSQIPFLRLIGKIEAVSFLVLLGVAMPLKYMAGMPMAVKVCGWIHGVLFITFCVTLLRVWTEARWPISRAALLFGAALFPFGPFLIGRRLAGYEEEFQRGTGGA